MSVYEQIKSDLGYLKLDAAAAVFATLAEEARTEDWSHIEFLARLVAEQATADRDRRLAARLRYARFPYRRTVAVWASSHDWPSRWRAACMRLLTVPVGTDISLAASLYFIPRK